MTIDELKRLNNHIAIINLEDLRFNQYGKVLRGYDFTEILKYAEENISIPAKENCYVPSVKELEVFQVANIIRDEIYGDMPIEVGSCAGQNTALTGLEYHQGSEVVIAATDCILILGRLQDIKDNTYDGKKAEAFFQPKGTAVELYSTTLHYSPCRVSEEGFMTMVILPAGTNFPLESTNYTRRNILLTKKNKFLMVHNTQKAKIESGVHPGLTGELIEIKLK